MEPILVVGSLAYDTISTPLGHAEKALGGSANYFSVAASMYVPIKVVGVVGEDYTDADLKILSSRGIDTKGIIRKKGLTFHWEGRYQGDMSDAITLATHLNVFETFDPHITIEHAQSKVVFLANIDPEIQLKVLEQVDAPQLVILDTMNYWIKSKLQPLKAVLKRTNVLLVNEGEATLLTGEQNAIGAAQSLTKMGPNVVIIKRGEYGSLLYFENKFFVLPAFPLATVVDPTGAGDTFAGGFVGYLCQNNCRMDLRTLKSACFEGSLLASFTVQDFGLNKLIQIAKPDIQTRWKEYFSSVQLDLS